MADVFTKHLPPERQRELAAQLRGAEKASASCCEGELTYSPTRWIFPASIHGWGGGVGRWLPEPSYTGLEN